MLKFLIPKRDNKKFGFTLIELLVVIAIIGVLASIVLASLNSARRKSRDARRITDLKQIQLALELYFDAQSSAYPPGSLTCDATTAFGLQALTPTYIPQVPRDPLGTATTNCYRYASGVISGGSPTTYHLAARLEDGTNPSFSGDKDCDSAAGTVVCATGANYAGGATTDGTGDAANRYYDLAP